MSDLHAEIDAALRSDNPISRDDVLRWFDVGHDIVALSKLYHLTWEHYYRINPELGRYQTCSIIQTYLLECIRQNVQGRDDVQDRWEAAHTLNVWLYHLMEKDAVPVLRLAAEAITELFLSGDDGVRDAIEMGFLEHVLETVALRSYFERWSTDERLRPAWTRATEWGKAHPDFIWGVVKQLKDIQF